MEIEDPLQLLWGMPDASRDALTADLDRAAIDLEEGDALLDGLAGGAG